MTICWIEPWIVQTWWKPMRKGATFNPLSFHAPIKCPPALLYLTSHGQWIPSTGVGCGCRGQMLSISYQERLTGHRGLTLTIGTGLVLSLLCDKVLLHPVLDCIVFSLVTLISRCKKHLDFHSRQTAFWWSLLISMELESSLSIGTGAQYSARQFHHTLLARTQSHGHT